MIIANLGYLGQGGGWDLSNGSYDSKSKSVTTEETQPVAVYFSTDGTKMYAIGNTNNKAFQYTLSTPWDVSTASYATKSLDTSTQTSTANSIHFNTDGTKMYALDNTNDIVYQYTLSTGWDASTGSYASKSKDVSTETTNNFGLHFSLDGTKMYVLGGGIVYQYTLSTAWDVSSASYASKNKTVSTEDATQSDISFRDNGAKMYVVGRTNDKVYQYNLSTPWDVSTASYATKFISVGSEDTEPFGLYFNQDGSSMYIMGLTNDTVYEYSL